MTEEDRTLVNWLSTRVTSDGTVLASTEGEFNLIWNRLVTATKRGLLLTPGRYLPRSEKEQDNAEE